MQDRMVSLAVLGDSRVGKTALVSKACSGAYSEIYRETVGTDFSQLYVNEGNEKVKLNIWDFSGAERFKVIRSSYFRNMTFVMVCCDVENANPRAAIQPHVDFVRDIHPEIPIFIVLTKADLVANQQVKSYIDTLVAEEKNCHYFGEVSVSNQTQAEIKALFERSLDFFTPAMEIKKAKEEALDTFFKKYDELKAQEKTPAFMRRTHVDRDNPTFESLIQNARHKKSAEITTNQAFLKLGWFNDKKEVTVSAPQVVHDADVVLRSKQLIKK